MPHGQGVVGAPSALPVHQDYLLERSQVPVSHQGPQEEVGGIGREQGRGVEGGPPGGRGFTVDLLCVHADRYGTLHREVKDTFFIFVSTKEGRIYLTSALL